MFKEKEKTVTIPYRIKDIKVSITDVGQLLVERVILFNDTHEYHSCDYLTRESFEGLFCGPYEYIAKHGFNKEMFGEYKSNVELDFIDGDRKFFVGLEMNSGAVNAIGFSTMKEAAEWFEKIRAWKYDHVEEDGEG